MKATNFFKQSSDSIEQQEEMYREKKHQIEDRIVSLSQPWVRPIVRGKTNAAVEFGAKVSISMVDGYAYVECLNWNAYNEGATLMETAEKYRRDNGFYPERMRNNNTNRAVTINDND